MSQLTFIKTYEPPKFNKKEIFRYASMNIPVCNQNIGFEKHAEISEIDNIVDECIKECESFLSYKVCYRYFPLKISDNFLDLSFASTYSSDLAKNLSGCNEIVLFAATLGIGIDRLILKYTKISPIKALLLQAIGTERAEALCDIFCKEIKGRPRFSPGYGDLPLELQKDIFYVLDCNKIGLTLNESLLMSPSKSVTAIVGLDK